MAIIRLFLVQGEVRRLGSTNTFRVDVRVITATNANLKKLVQERMLREDLYYRLSVFPIKLLPLRDRMGDLLPLTHACLSIFSAHSLTIAPEAAAVLRQHT